MASTTAARRGAAAVLVILVLAPAAAAAASPRLAWGHREFSTADSLSAWLAERGRAYETWAALHPRGRAILEHGVTPTPPRRPSPAPRPVPAGIVQTSSSHAPWPGWISTTLLALAAAMLVVAALPLSGLEVRGIAVLSISMRFALAAFGLALAAVVALAAAG